MSAFSMINDRGLRLLGCCKLEGTLSAAGHLVTLGARLLHHSVPYLSKCRRGSVSFFWGGGVTGGVTGLGGGCVDV